MIINYKIYQIKEIEETSYAFHTWKYAASHDFSINDYKHVYSGEMESENILEQIFMTFNIERPDDFFGHSLSVSDVVALKYYGDDRWHWFYCDAIGWKEISCD